jgi:guanylate kinase
MIVTLTGPSCAGKSTLEGMLKGEGFGVLISTTTRAPRPGEVHGQHYYFVSREEFDDAAKNGKFVEIVQFGGNLYGGSVAEFERLAGEGKPIVAVVEPNGRDQIDAFAKSHGWAILKVYVGHNATTIGHRFLQRFAQELPAVFGRGSVEDMKKLLDTYAARMATMLTTEQAWINEAMTRDTYDLAFMRFDETTQEEIIKVIKGWVEFVRGTELPKAA